MGNDGAPLLTGRGLHKRFGPTPALRGVDISVAEGEVLAVMGASGSGKSTLLHCLAGVLKPDAGEVIFDGRRIDRMLDNERSRWRRTEFGFVFQFGQLVPELPVRENIALPLLLAGKGRRAALAEAGKWLPRLGLEESAGWLPGEVSGGQAQRAAVAGRWSPDPVSSSPTNRPARWTQSPPTRSWSCSWTWPRPRGPA